MKKSIFIIGILIFSLYFTLMPVNASSIQKELSIQEITTLINSIDITKPVEAAEKLISIINKYSSRFNNQNLRKITAQTAINITQNASIFDKEKLSVSKSETNRIVGVKTTDFADIIDNVATVVDKLKLSMQSAGMKEEGETLKKEIKICACGTAENKVTVLLSNQAIAKAQEKSVNIVLQNQYMKVILPYKSLSLKALKDKDESKDEIFLGILLNKLGRSTVIEKSKKLTGQAYEIKTNIFYEDESGKIKKEEISKFEGRIYTKIKYTEQEAEKVRNSNNLRVYTLGNNNSWIYQRVQYDKQNKTASFGTMKCGKLVVVEYNKPYLKLKK